MADPLLPLSLAHFGDGINDSYLSGMNMTELHQLLSLMLRSRYYPASIIVCHSQPSAWTPANGTTLCPTNTGLYHVGRVSFHTCLMM